MTDDPTRGLTVGTIVQLGPNTGNPAFAYCLMVVTEVKKWGVQGFVQALGTREDGPGGQAYYRETWEHVFLTGGTVAWLPMAETEGEPGTTAEGGAAEEGSAP